MSKEILVADFVEFKLTFPDDPYALRLNNFFYKMILKRRGGICTFIRANQSLRCGIEELKPAICLAYPLRLKEGKPTIRADAICPAQNKARVDMAKMSAQILSDCDWELATYKEIVRDWNVKANSNSGFEEFMLFASHEMDLEATPWGSVYRKIKRSIFSRR